MSATAVLSTKDKFIACLEASGRVASHPAAKEASAALNTLEFPTSKTERWKYTRTNKIVKTDFTVQKSTQAIDLEPYEIEGLDADTLVFVNGYYRNDLSSFKPNDNVIVAPLSEALSSQASIVQQYMGRMANHNTEIFTAINTAYAVDGGFIYVKDNTIVERPIHLINLTDGNNVLAQPRHLIVAGKSSKVDFVATYGSIGNGANLHNVVTEVWVGENAHVHLDKLQYESEDAYHIATDQVYQESNSTFTINTITVNGALVRNNLNIVVDATNCTSNLYGLYMPTDKQHVDNHTFVDHKKPHCESNELYKGIINDAATGVFNGKVFVRQDAQKTNAFQSNANILMTDDATINSKPELEIYADDVKCSHGSTTGQFDEEAVFYLRARGIGEDSARKLLTYAFVVDVLDNIENEAIRRKVDQLLEQRFNWVL